MFQLRPYQQKAIDDIKQALIEHDKVLFQLSTGGGKTFIFCNLIKEYLDKNFVILVNREELVDQTVKSLAKLGVASEAITPKVKKLQKHSNVYVAMERTLWNRITKHDNFLPKIDIAIADECHRAEFDKFVPVFNKVIGFTATPVRIERKKFWRCNTCGEESNYIKDHCGEEMQEWSREHKLSEHYQTIVLGPSINELIEEGFLMPEKPYAVKIADISKVKMKGDEYDTASIQSEYSTDQALFNVVKNYEAHCKGLKTMIFNASIEQAEKVYERFIEAGIENVKCFHSQSEKVNRVELVHWFKTTPGAILINVSVFTTGFDATSVEAIIVNRPTKSLSLWVQMVGRGARPCKEILKTDFIVIDGGDNIKEHGVWSNVDRDWENIFWNGYKPDRAKREVLEEVIECESCYTLIPKSSSICPVCGHVIVAEKKIVEKDELQEVAKPVFLAPQPKAEKIIKYALRVDPRVNFAYKVLENQILDLFKTHQVSKQLFLNVKANGKLDEKIHKYNCDLFWAAMKSELEQTQLIRLQTRHERIIKKIEEYYGIN